MSQQPSAWELHARQVIGSVLSDNRGLMEKVAFQHGLKATHLPGEYAIMWSVIQNEIYPNQNTVISPETLWAKSGKRWDLDWLKDLMFDGKPDRDAESSAQICVDYAMRAYHKKSMLSAIEQLENVQQSYKDTMAAVVARASTSAATEMKSTNIADVAWGSVTQLEAGEQDFYVTKTNIPWMDSKTVLRDGLRSKRLIAIAGVEKGRKTTLARNMMLGAARHLHGLEKQMPMWDLDPITGEIHMTWVESKQKFPVWRPNSDVSIAFLAYENDRIITTYDLMAMLAYEYLLFTRQQNVVIGQTPANEYCDGETIQELVLKGARRNGGIMSQAINYSLWQLDQMNINIYDADEEHGNLKSFDDMKTVLNGHIFVHGQGKHVIAFVDYAQLVANSGRLYDDMALFSREVLNTASGRNCTIIALSQMNRDYKKSKDLGIDGDTLGTKGGADLEQAVHNYFETEYDGENEPGILKAIQRRARRGRAGKSQYKEFPIHPPSGYILPGK